MTEVQACARPISILGKFQKWHNKCYIAEYFVSGVALSILDRGTLQNGIINVTSRNISSMASRYPYGGIFRQ